MAAIGKDPAFPYSALDPSVAVEGDRRRGRRDRPPIAVNPPSDTAPALTFASLFAGDGHAQIVHGLAVSIMPGPDSTGKVAFSRLTQPCKNPSTEG
jgi:hypothetical protein